MKKAVRNYSLIFRLAWLSMALSMVVLCGPVKRMIELRRDKNITSPVSLNKKLHTGYRDRRDSSASISNIGFHSVAPDDGFVLFFCATVLAAFVLVSGKRESGIRLFPAVIAQHTALFINYRQLRI